MNTLKKMIFLTNNTKTKSMATLKLEKQNSNIFGTVKTYNTIPDGEYLLGLKSDNNIIKQNTNIKDGCYNFILPSNFNLNAHLGCVLLTINDSEITPLLWGNEKDKNYKNIIVSTLKDSFDKLHKNSYTQNEEVKTSRMETSVDFTKNVSHSQTNEISTTIEEPHDDNNLEVPSHIAHAKTYLQENIFDMPQKNLIEPAASAHNNTYESTDCNKPTSYQHFNIRTLDEELAMQREEINKSSFQNIQSLSQISLEEENILSQNDIAIATTQTPPSSLFESNDNEIENIIDQELSQPAKSTHQFYDMIADQLDELFARYPEESNLAVLIPHSKWVKLDTDVDNKHYVVGIIYDNNDEKYICYGVPGSYNIEPPAEMRKYSQWLPTDTRDPYTNGYWVMYQDADTGENIFLND